MGKTERSKWAGAHESMRAKSEFQLLLTYSTRSSQRESMHSLRPKKQGR
jgi:hypothetical protein